MTQYLRNCWYMAGWAQDLGEEPIGRKLLGEQVVLYRGEGGKAIALSGICPHRFASLAMGKVHGNDIGCPYHGLRFSPEGACTFSPFNIDVPPGTSLRSFPLVERDDCLWIWMGDVDKVDEGLIPDFGYHLDPGMRVVRGTSFLNCDYELVADNLMDLTHARFIHPIFGGDQWKPEVSFSQDGDTVYSHYRLPPYPSSPFSDAMIERARGKMIDEVEYMRWQAPANMYLDIQFRIVGEPDLGDVPQPSSHMLTPEADGATHYFWASGIPADADMTDEEHFEGLRFAFDEEDAPVLEGVGKMMDGRDFWDMKPAILAFDQGGVRARRILRKKIHAEHGQD